MPRLSCNWNLTPFYSPNDILSGNVGTTDIGKGELSKDDIYDALSSETDETETINLEEGKGKKESTKIPDGETKRDLKTDRRTITEEESDISPDTEEEETGELDELAEIEEEIKEPTDEQLELTTPVRRREILAKYPNLFKEFPYLEKAYYREQQFTEVFPTINDAKLANDKAGAFDTYVGELFRGDTRTILKTIKAENENSFHQIVDNYLSALYEIDEPAYYHVVGNVNKMTIAHMVQEGKKSNNEEVIEAARVLHQFIFGNKEWTPPGKLSKESNKEANSIESERQQFLREKYSSAQFDLQTRLENILTATIDQNIDRNGAMTAYVKKAACNDAMSMLQKLVNSDSRFQTLQTKLWEAAIKDNFSKSSLDRIKSAFTTHAKTLLPSVLKKARNEALKGMGRRTKDDSEDINDGSTRAQTGPKDTRRTTSSSPSGRHTEKAKQIPKGMTTLEFLNSE